MTDPLNLRASLVQRPTEPERWVPTKFHDARTSMSRALSEYFGDQTSPVPGLTYPKFRSVNYEWADTNKDLKMPALAVVSISDGNYNDDDRQSTTLFSADGLTYVTSRGLTQTYAVTVWTSSNQDRSAFVALLEDASQPVVWMNGFRLHMPFYHGAVAVFDWMGVTYEDSEMDDARRYRRATFRMTGRCPVMRVFPTVPVKQIGVTVTVE